ncbi:MAG: ABC transporter permease [Chitinophagaceae bacterium]|nr:ABC transporter permease [Oligoflexus sp.]
MAQASNFRFMQWAAWRYLVARKGRHGLSFMTTFSILGVVIGVAALIVVLSVMGGFEQDLKAKMLRGEPHLEIIATNPLAGFSLKEHPLDRFKTLFPDAEAIEPYTQADVVIKQGKHLSAVVLLGVNPKGGGALWDIDTSMIEGKIESIGTTHAPVIATKGEKALWPGMVIGEGLAAQLGADLGDEITVLSPQATSSSTILSGGTVTRTYVVSGLFKTGITNSDSKMALVSLDEGRKFLADYDTSLDDDNYVYGVGVNSKDPLSIENYKNRVSKIPGIQGKSWKDSNSALLFALKLEKYTMGSILLLIVLVAAFSISGTMMMTVYHKKQQICLFRSLGMSERDVGRLYLLQGFTIGTVGIVGGLIVGLTLCFMIQHLRNADLPSNLVSLFSLPVKYLPVEYGVICLAAWILSLLGAFYPARIAAKQNPSQGLRY